MVTLFMNGLKVSVENGTTLLEAARFLGFPIPTLCHMEGLSPYGACRLCVVEIGEGAKSRLVSSCTYPAEEGLHVRTASRRVVRARKMILELLLASCPQSKVIQDLASAHDIRQQRFRQEYEDCILCGLCVRMCEEQMMAKAIGFRGARSRSECRHAVRCQFGSVPTVRRMYLCLPSLHTPMYFYRAREGNLRWLCESEPALHRQRAIPGCDVLHAAVCGVRNKERLRSAPEE